MSVNPEIRLVATVSELYECLFDIANQPTKPPSLYIDIEGINLGRNGSISVISIYIRSSNNVYVIDTHILGKEAFSTMDKRGNSLKAILESNIPKVVFDIRNDSDALFSHFQISVDGIVDVQLMELAESDHITGYLASLARCVEKDSGWSAQEKAIFTKSKSECQYEKFNERPLREDMLRCCVQDVIALPYLCDVYHKKLHNLSRCLIKTTTKDRIIDSQSIRYKPDGAGRAGSP